MSNPFVLDVHEILRQQGAPEFVHTSGAAPINLGGEMLAIPQGSTVTVDVLLTNLGEAVLADGSVSGTATGTCGRCLRPLETTREIKVSEVFGVSPDFITTDADDDQDAPPLVEDDRIDITQNVVNEAGLNAPFSPVCADYGLTCQDDTPEPDGVSEEMVEEETIDPRWAGLAKFADLVEEPEEGNPENGS